MKYGDVIKIFAQLPDFPLSDKLLFYTPLLGESLIPGFCDNNIAAVMDISDRFGEEENTAEPIDISDNLTLEIITERADGVAVINYEGSFAVLLEIWFVVGIIKNNGWNLNYESFFG
ncbi:hypothetical protein JTB14_005191 [Gonioctena quinquepunctata]|nr:hypothetical protein JTB14_005191 [Gonioctena quinquepunctata]